MSRSSKPQFDIRSLAIEFATTCSLIPFKNNPRSHDKDHVADIEKSVNEFGMVIPILCDDHNVIIAGHGTLLACQSAGLEEVPVIRVGHLSEAQKVALRIAHNRLCESGKWDIDRLASNFEILYDQDLGFDLTITGFDTGEIDVARLGGKESIKAQAKAAAEVAEVVELPPANDKPAALQAAEAKIERFRLYAMSDDLERSDAVLGKGLAFVYPASLLYLVSGLFEENADKGLCDAPILGMQRFVSGKTSWLDDRDEGPSLKLVRKFLGGGTSRTVFAKVTGGDVLNCDAISHGAFDDEPATLNSVATFLQ